MRVARIFVHIPEGSFWDVGLTDDAQLGQLTASWRTDGYALLDLRNGPFIPYNNIATVCIYEMEHQAGKVLPFAVVPSTDPNKPGGSAA